MTLKFTSAIEEVLAEFEREHDDRHKPKNTRGDGHKPPPPNGPEDYGFAGSNEQAKTDTKTPPLQWLNMSNWDSEPVPERKWAIRDRVPAGQAGLFSGEGGIGKSIIELMKDVAHVAGKDWLGSMPEPGPAFYIGAEDPVDELHIRLACIAKHCGMTFDELVKDGLYVLPLFGQDATLCARGRNGRIQITALYKQIYEAAGDIKPRNISIDTLSSAFAGSEIDRSQVYEFVRHMQNLAMVSNGGSVTVLSHPSLTGIATGTGLSGSTAWHGAFRFRQYLKGSKPEGDDQPDDNLRELEFKKNQYGPRGETIVVRYQRGLFLPEKGISDLDKLAREARIDELFVTLLRQFTKQGRNLSPNKSNIYAPAKFEEQPQAKAAKLSSKDFAAAMERLLAKNTIKVVTEGPPSHPRSRLVIC
jgi:RecA-family ATPase